MFKLMAKKINTILHLKICLSGPMGSTLFSKYDFEYSIVRIKIMPHDHCVALKVNKHVHSLNFFIIKTQD